MKTIQIIFIFLVLLTQIVFAAEKSGCIDGKIKYLDKIKEIVLQDRYCYDSLLRSISSVKKCAENKECTINLPGPFLLKHKDVQVKSGSPGFRVCDLLNGIPQFIEYWDGEFWIKSSRCIFNDGSYMDIAALTLKVKYVD
ncbi:MAG: hypothetical protein H7281_16780 [Bacteriovorax sp.]|nr:hypothetical protein [Bacteriovorax sp.]